MFFFIHLRLGMQTPPVLSENVYVGIAYSVWVTTQTVIIVSVSQSGTNGVLFHSLMSGYADPTSSIRECIHT